MDNIKFTVSFPSQRVSASEREKAEWYANCCDFVINSGIGCVDMDDIEAKYEFIKGNIPNEFYRKTLNPYNAENKDYQRFPATMRNYDIVSGIIRRYVGEYIQNPHDFIVGANNPEVVFAKDAKLKQEVMILVEQQISQRIQQAYQQFVNEGNNPEQFNPQEAVDIEQFIKDFNENYIDEITAQGQEILKVIDDITDATTLYAHAYFEWVTFGSFYTYTDIVGDKLVKRVVKCRDAFPTPNDSILVEDYDMFAERRMMTAQQIMDEYGDYLDSKQKDFFNYFYANGHTSNDDRGLLYWDKYQNAFVDECRRFTEEERNFFRNQPIMNRDRNGGLIEVWKAVWRGEAKRGILTYQANGLITTRIVDETYELNKEAGDIDIEWVWEPQVYESIRIGTRNEAIYPIKARPIAYNRNGKLPYNGIMELLPGFGKFSIVDIVAPYQIFGNIVAYHREMAIAKNKLNVLMIAKSLLGEEPEETIYRMAADGVLYIDDEDDAGMLKAQQVRMLQSQANDYIIQLGQLLAENEEAAMMKVDMTAQRYGAIANSAGKGVTEQAIIRGSMGSVIVEYMFDFAREHDYARDLDYTKLAWIDGLNTAYRDRNNGSLKYLSLDVNSHLYADYIIKAKLSAKERDKLNQYKQFAFSAAQNGDMEMAAIAIEGDNTAEIKQAIKKFQELKRQHEMQMKQMDQELEQLRQQGELVKIQAKGEQDRETISLEKYLDGQIEATKAILNGSSSTGSQTVDYYQNNLEREKLAFEREKANAERDIKREEIAAKRYDSDIKLKVAKQNKNKYDKK